LGDFDEKVCELVVSHHLALVSHHQIGGINFVEQMVVQMLVEVQIGIVGRRIVLVEVQIGFVEVQIDFVVVQIGFVAVGIGFVIEFAVGFVIVLVEVWCGSLVCCGSFDCASFVSFII
jgi:hypothetical protein